MNEHEPSLTKLCRKFPFTPDLVAHLRKTNHPDLHLIDSLGHITLSFDSKIEMCWLLIQSLRHDHHTDESTRRKLHKLLRSMSYLQLVKIALKEEVSDWLVQSYKNGTLSLGFFVIVINEIEHYYDGLEDGWEGVVNGCLRAIITLDNEKEVVDECRSVLICRRKAWILATLISESLLSEMLESQPCAYYPIELIAYAPEVSVERTRTIVRLCCKYITNYVDLFHDVLITGSGPLLYFFGRIIRDRLRELLIIIEDESDVDITDTWRRRREDGDESAVTVMNLLGELFPNEV